MDQQMDFSVQWPCAGSGCGRAAESRGSRNCHVNCNSTRFDLTEWDFLCVARDDGDGGGGARRLGEPPSSRWGNIHATYLWDWERRCSCSSDCSSPINQNGFRARISFRPRRRTSETSRDRQFQWMILINQYLMPSVNPLSSYLAACFVVFAIPTRVTPRFRS